MVIFLANLSTLFPARRERALKLAKVVSWTPLLQATGFSTPMNVSEGFPQCRSQGEACQWQVFRHRTGISQHLTASESVTDVRRLGMNAKLKHDWSSVILVA